LLIGCKIKLIGEVDDEVEIIHSAVNAKENRRLLSIEDIIVLKFNYLLFKIFVTDPIINLSVKESRYTIFVIK